MKSNRIIFSRLALLAPLVVSIASAQFFYPQDNQCTTPNQRPGTCINIRNCQSLVSLLQSGRITPQVKDFLQRSTCGYEGRDPKVCCERNSGAHVPTSPQTPPSDSESPPNVRNHPNLRLLESNCGVINDNKIIGGQVSGINEFPWMALLAYDVGKAEPEFRCGGSVINRRYVLTAAHCVTNLPSNLRLSGVRVGEHDINSDIDCQGEGVERICNARHQDFGIDEVTFHSEYSRTKLHNDVALIRLNRDIDFRPANAKAICMPISIGGVIPNKLVVSGWGVTESRMSSPVMMKVKLPRYSQDECASVYKRQTEIWYKQMCVGGEVGKDSCNGDSGGPLQSPTVNNGKLKYVQYGIVSFGVRSCGTGGFPGVYTRVDYYLDWILNTIRP